MTRENRRVTRASESAIAKVILEYFDETAQEWRTGPARYAFLSDEKARTYAEVRYAPGVKVRTTADSRVTVTRSP